jgi:hypothetical protein
MPWHIHIFNSNLFIRAAHRASIRLLVRAFAPDPNYEEEL